MPPKIIEMIQWDKPLSCTVWTTVHLKHILQCIFKSLNNLNICHGCMNVLKFLLDGCTKALFLKNWRRSDISHFHDLTNIENRKSCQKFRFFFFFLLIWENVACDALIGWKHWMNWTRFIHILYWDTVSLHHCNLGHIFYFKRQNCAHLHPHLVKCHFSIEYVH